MVREAQPARRLYTPTYGLMELTARATADPDAMVAQVDGLIMSAVAALEGRSEAEMVRRLLRVRDAVGSAAGAVRSCVGTDAVCQRATVANRRRPSR